MTERAAYARVFLDHCLAHGVRLERHYGGITASRALSVAAGDCIVEHKPELLALLDDCGPSAVEGDFAVLHSEVQRGLIAVRLKRGARVPAALRGLPVYSMSQAAKVEGAALPDSLLRLIGLVEGQLRWMPGIGFVRADARTAVKGG